MSEVELRNLRYRGDHPSDYENKAYQQDTGGSKDSVLPDYEDVVVRAEPQTSKFEDSDRSGSYTVGNNNVEVVIDAGAEPEEEEEDDEPSNCCLRHILTVQKGRESCWDKHSKKLSYAVGAAFIILYFGYFGFAMNHEFGSESSVRLLWMTALVIFFVLLNIFWFFCGDRIKDCCRPCTSKLAQHERLISWVLVTALLLAIIVFVFVDVFVNTKQPYNLVSLAGICIYVLIFFVFSRSPAQVQWRAVAWGLGLQFLFAILILRWDRGYSAFQWLGDRVTEFLDYSDVGAEFIFGPNFRDHFFAFKILPTIIFFSTAISVLYYWGAMQVIVKYVAMVMQFAMGTTAGESLNAAGNIFIGQTEAPLLIRPLLPDMTRSELHAVMTGGFATIAGGVLAAYIGFNVPANHLISASVMSAPAALGMAKLIYPETVKSKTTAKDISKLPPSDEVNFIAAASNGASQSIKLVANIAVNLIAFLSILAFINTALTWFGHRVGWYEPELTFELICSYLLYPCAFIMGVDPKNCRQVAKLVGIKTFLNEFIAYTELGVLIDNRALYEGHQLMNGTFSYVGDNIIMNPLSGQNRTVLLGGVMTVRSEVISTYALCGFANIGSIGIQLGALSAMAPQRRNDLASVAVYAMIAGNVACFMTACIAGLFYQG